MSKGLGHIQRSVLAFLETDPTGRWEGGQCWTYASVVIKAIAGEHPSVSECVSIRCAIRGLTKVGKIEHQGRQLRLVPSPTERAIYDEGWRKLVGEGRKCFGSRSGQANETLREAS
jgi:hypothetical protein